MRKSFKQIVILAISFVFILCVTADASFSISTGWSSANPVIISPGETIFNNDIRPATYDVVDITIRHSLTDDAGGLASLPGGVDYIDYLLPAENYPGQPGYPAVEFETIITAPLDAIPGTYSIIAEFYEIPPGPYSSHYFITFQDAIVVTPEPSTLLLFSLGAIFLRTRRKV